LRIASPAIDIPGCIACSTIQLLNGAQSELSMTLQHLASLI
jgi:hypothetical protein